MDRGIAVNLIWKDNDMVEARIAAWNGAFGGVADVYLSYGTLNGFANTIAGFPKTSDDDREYLLGELNPDGGGGARLRFHSVDMAGHIGTTLSLATGNRVESNQEVILFGALEAAAIDEFVAELLNMRDEVGSKAFLRFVI